MISWRDIIIAVSVTLAAPLAAAPAARSEDARAAVVQDPVGVLAAIADDIAALREEFPQLRQFSRQADLDRNGLRIDYAYDADRPGVGQGRPRGGWMAHVPQPRPDGVWFHINLHDANSVAEIDTQPVVAHPCLGQKRVTFLILEGSETRSLAARLWAILVQHGARDCA